MMEYCRYGEKQKQEINNSEYYHMQYVPYLFRVKYPHSQGFVFDYILPWYGKSWYMKTQNA